MVGHYVAYRKLVSPSPTELLPEDQFRIYAVCARFPHNLSGEVPWQERQTGVYHCRWGTDVVSVVVAGMLPLEPHNAPLHLFSASAERLGFGQSAYRQRSERTSLLLGQLFERIQEEDIAMAYTFEDFRREYVKKNFSQLTPAEQQDILSSLPPEERLAGLPPEERLAGLPPEERLAGLSVEQIRKYLEGRTASRPTAPRKQRRKK